MKMKVTFGAYLRYRFFINPHKITYTRVNIALIAPIQGVPGKGKFCIMRIIKKNKAHKKLGM